MISKTLGAAIRELRLEKGLSVRGLASKVEKSAPFISDIELGRRYPSAEVLKSIAGVLKVDIESLAALDTRSSLEDMKGLVAQDPSWGLAFRKVAAQGLGGELDAAELLRRLEGRGSRGEN